MIEMAKLEEGAELCRSERNYSAPFRLDIKTNVVVIMLRTTCCACS
jgi:hypothetical protein